LNDFNGLNSSDSMNVLIVTGIFPPDIGGPATYVPTMASELVKRGHKITVVTLSEPVDYDDRSYGFRVQRIRRSAFKPWRLLLTVLRILRDGRSAHVLYVNGLYLESVTANFLLRKPMVQKIVGDWAWERATNKGWVKDTFEEFQKCRHDSKLKSLKILRSFCARRADAVIVPSQYLARAVAAWGVSDSKIIVVYNTIDATSTVRATIPLSTPVTIVTAGRLIPLKQIDDVIESLADCSEAGLVIVGEGPERGRLEHLVRSRQLLNRVYFAGQKTKDETIALMAACDLFVLNSTHEGFPHVLLEAMSLGLPVVATAVGGTPELVRDGENGFLIAPNANGALSKTLMRLISSSEERHRLAAGARETMRRFRQSAMIEATEATLRAWAYS
jgi:glycosyltransferase involved in cell wall biosynthesis